jgi:hypothetical protein
MAEFVSPDSMLRERQHGVVRKAKSRTRKRAPSPITRVPLLPLPRVRLLLPRAISELAESSWITMMGGAAYRASSKYKAVCRATRRGRARPYRHPNLMGSCSRRNNGPSASWQKARG